jgi:hypothetical protein
MDAEITKLIAELANDLRPAIAALEAAPAATKHHYGAYMGILNRIARKNKIYAKAAALAMVKAGANREGVAAAYRLSFGGED